MGTSPVHVQAAAARDWLQTIADRLGTTDLQYSRRLLRAWLHTVRDQLAVPDATELANGLPELLRGEFYTGWQPATLPVTRPAALGADGFVDRFARAARVSAAEVRYGALIITRALGELLPAGRLDAVLDRLPDGVRAVLAPVNRYTVTLPSPRRPAPDATLARVAG